MTVDHKRCELLEALLLCCWFIDGEYLVAVDVFEPLDYAAWPMDLDQVGAGIGAQAEVGPLVAGGEVAAGRGDSNVLRAG